MAPIISAPILAAPAPAVVPQAFPAASNPAASNPAEVERLRALIAGSAPAAPAAPAPVDPAAVTNAPADVTPVEPSALGDSILGSIVKFKSGYNESMDSMAKRIEHMADMGPVDFGSSFADIVALQVDVAKWSMAVMGVDNASKAGTNTIKELSRGG